MSIFQRMGEEANEKIEKGGGEQKEKIIVPFKSGTTYKVAVRDINEAAEYYGYGCYQKVNTFVPENPAARNKKGFIESGATPWDLASDYWYKKFKASSDAGDPETVTKPFKEKAAIYRGKRRVLRVFIDLDTGKEIVVDLSGKQSDTINVVLEKNKSKFRKFAFELSKEGERNETAVSLTPIADLDDEADISPAQKANFEKVASMPKFDLQRFADCLYIAKADEQLTFLAAAGFNVALLDVIGGSAPAPDDDGPIDINADDLPF